MVLLPVVVILERCSTAQGPVRPASCACNTDTSAESAWGRGCPGSSKAAHVRSDRVERPAHISKPTRRDRGQRKSRTQSRWKESFTGASASLERAGADMDKGHRFPVRTNCAAGGGWHLQTGGARAHQCVWARHASTWLSAVCYRAPTAPARGLPCGGSVATRRISSRVTKLCGSGCGWPLAVLQHRTRNWMRC
jgi:hypothetical protein